MAYSGADAGNHMLGGAEHEYPPQRFPNVGLPLMPNAFVPEGSGNWRNMSMQQYYSQPLPKSEKVCLVFVHTGFCSFADRCRYRHPTPENNADDQVDDGQEENNGKASETEKSETESATEKSSPIIPCKFYPTGVCKNGEKCRFDHSMPQDQQHFNIMGLPYRLGEPECSYYMRNGWCGYGLACKFHHPDPIDHHHVNYYHPAPETYAEYEARDQYFEYDQYYGSSAGGYFMLNPPHHHQGYINPQPPMNMIGTPFQPNFSWNPPYNQQEQVSEGMMNSYRPYPRARVLKVSHTVLNEAGLPQRPGKRVCWHYERSGHCRYGSKCVFDHPPRFSSDVDEAATSKSAPSPDKASETHE